MNNGYVKAGWCMALIALFWLAFPAFAVQSANYSAFPTPFVSGSGSASSASFLQAGVLDYSFTRVASNSANYIDLTTVLPPSVAAATVPGAPTIGVATAGNAQAIVNFTAPASNGGALISGYTATSNPGGFTGSGTNSPIAVTGLTNGIAYTFTVTATNAIGTSAASSASNSATPFSAAIAPGAPTNVTAAPGNNSITLTFSPPSSIGSSPLTGYTATCGTNINIGSTSPITVSGLTNGTAYSCKVNASNDAGNGPDSATVSATPVGQASAALSASSLSFGILNVGSQSVNQSLFLINTGNSPLSISSMTITGDFAKGTVCGKTLAGGASCLVLLSFTPTASGIRSGLFSIVTSASNIPLNVSLVGTGASTLPHLSGLSLTGATLSPSFSVGTTSYGTSLANTSSSVIVTASTNDAGAVISVNGATITNGGASTPIPLNFGVNTLTVRVTAADTVTSNDYTLAINRLAPIITGGSGHSIALKPDGTLWVWGHNYYGQLGDSTTVDASIPESIGGGYVAVAAGNYHSAALKSDGSLWTWGNNAYGQLGDNTTVDSHKPKQIDIGYKVVAAGATHTLAIRNDGSLWAWGSNDYGQLGNGTIAGLKIPTRIGTGYKAVAAGLSHTLGLQEDGSLWAWGRNMYGQLGDGTMNDSPVPKLIGTHFVAISAAGFHSIGLKDDNTLWAWGWNNDGQAGDGTTNEVHAPKQIGSGYRAIAAGANHNLALGLDDSLWTWGGNDSGQLGNGTTVKSLAPIQIGTGFSTVTAGNGYTVALKNDGSVWAQGANWFGQLGDGTLVQRQTAALAVNNTVDGPLDLIPTAAKNIPLKMLPPYWLEVTTTNTVNTAITYNSADLNQNGNVYVVAYLDPNSPLLAGTTLPAGISHASTITRAGTTLVAAVLTRTGWKQAAAGVATAPLLTGTLTTSNNTVSMYNTGMFDQTKDTGIFCVAYAGASTTSAKGLIRPVVMGLNVSTTDCPAIQTTAIIDTQLPSIPTNLSAIASGNQINLTWTAANDNVAVTTYNVYRNGVITPLAILGNVTNYSDSAVVAGTTYSYTVQACDAAQNCSAQSVAAQATISKANQSINFTPPATATYGDAALILSASASSALPVTFTLVSGPAILTGSSLAITGAGKIVVKASQSGNSNYSAAAEVTQSITVVSTATLNLLANWNLLGNSVNVPLTVANIFSDQSKVATVWKWIASSSKWAFYTPSLGDGGQAYATAKGYDFLTTINGGEGYWVNAKTAFPVSIPSGAAVNAIYFQEQIVSAQNKLVQGWNLIAIGDNLTPGDFNRKLSLTPPAQGIIPLNVTTLWAWDSGLSSWYFYAPSLEISNGLGNYITNKGYLDFTLKGKTLDPTTGFWVNKP